MHQKIRNFLYFQHVFISLNQYYNQSGINTLLMEDQNLILEFDTSLNAQFVSTGQRPSNFIKNVSPSQRYNKYPKANQLMQQKKQWIRQRNHPPVFIKQDLKKFDLSKLGKFDTIYCDPPWKQYERRARDQNIYDHSPEHYKSFQVEQLKNLKVQDLADTPCFLFLWVGSDHLADGRQIMKKWGFKRCEDIVWVKTNIVKKRAPPQSKQGILVRVKEHCLVGYKGQTKKASDHTFIHPNIDIDVVVTEQPQAGSLEKPIEVYEIIQRFCLGRKKIELFGTNDNIRNGWLTVGHQLSQTKFSLQEYNSWFEQVHKDQNNNLNSRIEYKDFKGGRRMGTTPVIESLRPRQQQKNEDDGKKSINSNK